MKFNIESPIFQFITTLSEFVLLNILFIITCLPLFTIGTSLSSLYYVTMQEARQEHGYIVKNYFKAWKENFAQSTILWILYLIISYILVTALIVYQTLDNFVGNAITVSITLFSFLLIISFLYIFPLLARFKNSMTQSIKNSFLIALHNIKTTILLVLINCIFIYLCKILPWSKIFMILLGFAFLAYCNSFLYIRVFKKYEPQDVTDTKKL
ncbi:YesL family protein [Clostridium sp. Marseille-P299]|uniref:YesL family protein n=1 Tax=Clostridium sp. Marseille-P299 TaxID=1805477 RepID=UPI00082B1C42|nr:DUF624 domain-containing protein [Clostridium sp. Marseille-P299]